MSAFGRVLLDQLDDADLGELARRIAPLMPQEADEWMSTANAAAYTGRSVAAMHRLIARGAVPFHQEAPGCKCWFRRSELDAWQANTNVSIDYNC